MVKEVGLWVCPKCSVLQGIEVWIDDEKLNARCVNCGVPLDINDIHFVDQDVAIAVIEKVEHVVPKFLHEYIRYSWVSNKTIGLIFEFGVDELIEEVDYDPRHYFEDVLGDSLGLTMTVYFEH